LQSIAGFIHVMTMVEFRGERAAAVS